MDYRLAGENAMKRVCTIGLCLAAVWPAMAMEIRYSANSGKFEAIRIDSDQPETDSLLYAVCVTPAMFEVLIGDELKFGSGDHEPVSATLSDGTLSTKVDGVSVRSPDYEMTGGTMLLTTLEPKGRAWRILTSGKKIEIRPKGGEPETVSLGKAATDALKAFASRCS